MKKRKQKPATNQDLEDLQEEVQAVLEDELSSELHHSLETIVFDVASTCAGEISKILQHSLANEPQPDGMSISGSKDDLIEHWQERIDVLESYRDETKKTSTRKMYEERIGATQIMLQEFKMWIEKKPKKKPRRKKKK